MKKRTQMYGFFGQENGEDSLLTLHTNKGDIPCAFQLLKTADLLRPIIEKMGISCELLEFEFKRVVEKI